MPLSQFDPHILIWPVLFGIGLYIVLVSQPVGRPKTDLAERLRRLDVDERILFEMGRREVQPIFTSRALESLLRPVMEDIGRLLRSALDRFGLAGGAELDRQLRLVRPGVEPVQFFGEKVMAGLVIMSAFPIMNAFDITLFGPWPLWTWLIGFALGFMSPNWQIRQRLANRRTTVIMELPTILDMLTIATSAGLALEQAMIEVARHSSGVIAQELQRASREMALGQVSLTDALEMVAARNNIPELTSLVGQLRSAHEQGLPLVLTLSAQAEALREQQRLRIIEEGGKASIRMLLPVALFILPVLFVVVLVPAAVELMQLGG
jgi:tight adherence protein C